MSLTVSKEQKFNLLIICVSIQSLLLMLFNSSLLLKHIQQNGGKLYIFLQLIYGFFGSLMTNKSKND